MSIYLEIRLILTFILCLTVISCASFDGEETEPDPYEILEIDDPDEEKNRENFEKFMANLKDNQEIFDEYKKVPNYFKERISDFNRNMMEPASLVASLLQGKIDKTFISFFRMLINFSLGLFGTIDIASELGIKPVDEDFGQVFATWGIPSGKYLVSPTTGPTTVRDLYGSMIAAPLRPTLWSLGFDMPYPLIAIESQTTPLFSGIDFVSKNGEMIKNIYNSSIDPYETFKSFYLSRRQAQINQ